MKFGYGRVSTADQNPNLQIDALKAEGCEEFFIEKRTGRHMERPELKAMIDKLRKGDTVVVWKLSRLGRSMPDMVRTLLAFEEKGVHFQCIAIKLDTSTASGRLFQNMLLAFDQFERENMVENTRAGLEAARQRGHVGGRPKGLSEDYRRISVQVQRAHTAGDSIRQIMKAFTIPSSATVYKILQYAKDETMQTVEKVRKG